MMILKNKKAFTLIETIIYVLLFSIIMTSVVNFGILISFLNSKNLLLREANANARNVLNFISTEIANARSISSPLVGNSSSTIIYLSQDNNLRKISLEDGGLYLISDNTRFNISRSNILFSNLLFLNLGDNNLSDSIQFSFNYSSLSTTTREFFYENILRSAVTRRF